MTVSTRTKHKGSNVKFVVSPHRTILAGEVEEQMYHVLRVERLGRSLSIRKRFADVYGPKSNAQAVARMLNESL